MWLAIDNVTCINYSIPLSLDSNTMSALLWVMCPESPMKCPGSTSFPQSHLLVNLSVNLSISGSKPSAFIIRTFFSTGRKSEELIFCLDMSKKILIKHVLLSVSFHTSKDPAKTTLSLSSLGLILIEWFQNAFSSWSPFINLLSSRLV